LGRGQLQLRSDALLQPTEVLGSLVLTTPAKQQETIGQQPLANLARQAASPSDALEVPQQVRPAHLALFKGQIVVARIPITHRDKAGLFSQHQLGSELAA